MVKRQNERFCQFNKFNKINSTGAQLFACADPESFVRGGPTQTFFFLVDEGREDQNTPKSGPSSARQPNDIGMDGVSLAHH